MKCGRFSGLLRIQRTEGAALPMLLGATHARERGRAGRRSSPSTWRTRASTARCASSRAAAPRSKGSSSTVWRRSTARRRFSDVERRRASCTGVDEGDVGATRCSPSEYMAVSGRPAARRPPPALRADLAAPVGGGYTVAVPSNRNRVVPVVRVSAGRTGGKSAPPSKSAAPTARCSRPASGSSRHSTSGEAVRGLGPVRVPRAPPQAPRGGRSTRKCRCCAPSGVRCAPCLVGSVAQCPPGIRREQGSEAQPDLAQQSREWPPQGGCRRPPAAYRPLPARPHPIPRASRTGRRSRPV